MTDDEKRQSTDSKEDSTAQQYCVLYNPCGATVGVRLSTFPQSSGRRWLRVGTPVQSDGGWIPVCEGLHAKGTHDSHTERWRP